MSTTEIRPQGVSIPGISEPILQATARTIEMAAQAADGANRGIDPSRNVLTRGDFERTLDWVQAYKHPEADKQSAKNPLNQLPELQLELLTSATATTRLQELDRRLTEAATAKLQSPLLLSVRYDAFTNPAIRACAQAVADAYTEGPANSVLAVGPLIAAWNDMQAVAAGKEPHEAYAKAAASPAFTTDNVEALRIYMALGLGGLVNNGCIKSHGFVFDRVFKLPLLAEVPLPDGKPFTEQPADKKQAILAQNVELRKKQFADTGYDCVYVVSDDNALFVALHSAGALTGLSARAPVDFVDPERSKTVDFITSHGTVLDVVDVDNTLQEATSGFWARTFGSWGRWLGSSARSASEKPLTALAAVSNNVKPDKDAPPANTSTPWLAAIGLTGLAAALPGPQQVAAFVAIGGAALAVGTTGLSIWSLVYTGKNIVPFLDAIGHSVNVQALREDEV